MLSWGRMAPLAPSMLSPVPPMLTPLCRPSADLAGVFQNGTASVTVPGPIWMASSLDASTAVENPEGTILTLALWELGESTAGCSESAGPATGVAALLLCV